MADVTTTNLALVEPEVGASTDTWGTKINADLSIIDALFNSSPALLVTKGGTGATTAAGARTNLGITSFQSTVQSNSANVTLTAGDSLLLVKCDATSASFTVTLYTAVGHSGAVINIKKTDSTANTVTIDGNSTETIDGALTQTLYSQWDCWTLVSDGTNWMLV
jgi:hypothetical protein